MSASIGQRDVKELLSSIAIFSLLTEAETRRLSEQMESQRFTLGQAVCRPGVQDKSLFVVVDGRARIVGTNDEGKEITINTLRRGDTFGGYGLFGQTRNAYSVRAMGDLELLRLGENEFARLLNQYPQMRGYFAFAAEESSLEHFLKLSTIFTPLPPEKIRWLISCLETHKYAPGEMIEAEQALYLIRSGSVRLSQNNHTFHRKAGNVFGELSVLTENSPPFTATAQEPVILSRLSKEDFVQLGADVPAFREAVVRLAAGFDDLAMHQSAPRPKQPTGQFPVVQIPKDFVSDSAWRPRRARRYPALLQLSETDCGAACLAMILRYFGRQLSINRLRETVNVGRDGASLHSIAEGAERLGFHTRCLRATDEHLEKIECPVIAHWEGMHYVVLYEVGPEYVVMADPASGLRRMTRAEFSKGWTGYLLALTPTQQIEQVEESQSTFKRFLPLIKPYRKLLLEIFAASLLLQLFGLAAPIFTQVLVDRVVVHQNLNLLNLMLVGMLLVALFQTATVALRYYLIVHTTRRLDMQMVVNFYQHLLSLPLRYFEERKIGDILKRFNENQRIRDLLTGRALGVVLDVLMVIVYLSLMFFYNAKLALLALVFIPGYAVLVLVMTPRLRRQFRANFVSAAEADSCMVESISGIGTVKATASERRIRWKLEDLMAKALNAQFRTQLLGMAGSSFGNVLQTLSTVLLLWYGARLVIGGELTVGQLVAFNVLTASVTRPILSLIDLWNEFQEVGIALERLNDVFDAKPEEDHSQSAALTLPPVKGHIKLSGVTFRYPTRPDRNALQNVNLEIQAGKTVALVGRSGAGKTTFANLLLRLHEPNEGRVYIDGYDVRQLSLASLRSQIGVVPQDVFLFSGTIRENIAFGDPDAPLEEVVGAAMLAGAHDFISELPLGYETKIGERGQSLSGGQKQRIAIARALYKKPRILIFDEATSALDTESERAIQRNLDQILKDRTTFIIAHRLSTVRNADLIVVLDRGAIVELGTHESLLAQRGLYYYLNAQQLES